MTNKEIYDYWNNRTPYTWGKYKDMRKLRYELQDYMFDTFRFQDFKGKKVLEIGCGSGIDSAEFAKYGADIYATDMTDKAVNHTKNLFKRLNMNEELISRIKKVNATNLPFEDNFFDLVYVYGVLHHIPIVERALDEIYRVLKPGRQCFVMLYHKDSLLYYYSVLYLGGVVFKGFKKGLSEKEVLAKYSEGKMGNPYSKVYTKDEAKRLFYTSGFKDITVEVKYPMIDTTTERKVEIPNLPSNLGWHLIVKAQK